MTHDKFCKMAEYKNAPHSIDARIVAPNCTCSTIQAIRQDQSKRIAQKIEESPESPCCQHCVEDKVKYAKIAREGNLVFDVNGWGTRSSTTRGEVK